MSASVTTLQAMGQDDQYQARCKPCDWGGDVLPSRAAAMQQGIAHDGDAHAPESAMPADGPADVVKVDEILDQLASNAPRLAPCYAAHMDACVEAGFSREEALLLTSDWARVTLWGAQS